MSLVGERAIFLGEVCVFSIPNSIVVAAFSMFSSDKPLEHFTKNIKLWR